MRIAKKKDNGEEDLWEREMEIERQTKENGWKCNRKTQKKMAEQNL